MVLVADTVHALNYKPSIMTSEQGQQPLLGKQGGTYDIRGCQLEVVWMNADQVRGMSARIARPEFLCFVLTEKSFPCSQQHDGGKLPSSARLVKATINVELAADA